MTLTEAERERERESERERARERARERERKKEIVKKSKREKEPGSWALWHHECVKRPRTQKTYRLSALCVCVCVCVCVCLLRWLKLVLWAVTRKTSYF